jgi:hypothetical protein
MAVVDPPTRPSVGPVRLLWRWTKAAAITVFVCWQLFFLAWRNPADLWGDELHTWAAKQDRWDQVLHDFNKHRYPSAATSRLGRRMRAVEPAWERWYDPTEKWTRNYGRVFAVEQGWSMFTPNLARGGSFLTARLEFSDGSEELVKSPNEPALESDDKPRPKPFLRMGGWRQRKLEDSLAFTTPEKLARMDAADGDDLPLFEAYARWSVQRWRQGHPDDAREVHRIVLVRRRMAFAPLKTVWIDRNTREERTEAPPPGEESRYFTQEKSDPDDVEKIEQYTVGQFHPDGSLWK